LQPHPLPLRNTPIAGVFLTNADLDHTLGLVLMRQQETPLVVYARDDTKAALRWLDLVLQPFGGIEWRMITREFNSTGSGIAFRAIALDKSLAFQFRDEISGATVLIAPAVGQITEELRAAIREANALLFDGTFWSNDELRAVRPGARTAREMNHLPISESSLDLLRQAPARRKIYTHINNTNPILSPGSPERSAVEQAGLEIAGDGLEIIL
jgi:pyrroloquinoline quinone biosynthesis protein B